jgi:hypothetical protein
MGIRMCWDGQKRLNGELQGRRWGLWIYGGRGFSGVWMIRLMPRGVGFGREGSMLLCGMCLLEYEDESYRCWGFSGRLLRSREGYSGSVHQINGKRAGVRGKRTVDKVVMNPIPSQLSTFAEMNLLLQSLLYIWTQVL